MYRVMRQMIDINWLIQHLYERSWYAITETCLAMTIFREDFDLQFIVVFTTLLFLKIFHWLCQDRVEFVSINKMKCVLFDSWYNCFIIDGTIAYQSSYISCSYSEFIGVTFDYRRAISQSCYSCYTD